MDCNLFIPLRPCPTFGQTLNVFVVVLIACGVALAMLVMPLGAFVSSMAATLEAPFVVARAF